jgi:hypothetical protein
MWWESIVSASAADPYLRADDPFLLAGMVRLQNAGDLQEF